VFVSTKATVFIVGKSLQKGLASQCLLWTQWLTPRRRRETMSNEEERKSVHYRLPLFSRVRLRRLAKKRETSMTSVLVELIERAKL
jgi:hypothetical protein